MPALERVGQLDAAAIGLRTLLGTQDDQLVWQLAALLAFLIQGHGSELAEVAAAVAGRIVAGRLNVLRRALPSKDRGETHQSTVDRLDKGPSTVRELVWH